MGDRHARGGWCLGLGLGPVQARKNARKKNEKGKVLSFFDKKSMFISNDIQNI